MVNLNETNKKIPNIILILNFIYFVVGIFYVNKSLLISLTIFNIILLGTYIIFNKYGALFNLLIKTNILWYNLLF
jgi:hypothetical protein